MYLEAELLIKNVTITPSTQLNSLQHTYPDLKLISEGNTTLAGYPAYEIIFTATKSNNRAVKVTEIWTEKEGKIYFVDFRASTQDYDAYAETAQKIIGSFQIR